MPTFTTRLPPSSRSHNPGPVADVDIPAGGGDEISTGRVDAGIPGDCGAGGNGSGTGAATSGSGSRGAGVKIGSGTAIEDPTGSACFDASAASSETSRCS